MGIQMAEDRDYPGWMRGFVSGCRGILENERKGR